MSRSRSSRSKVFVEGKKDRKDKQLIDKITELELENAKLRREVSSLLAEGKVPVVKAAKVKKIVGPPKLADVEKEKQDVRDRFKKWRNENLGQYEEE